MRIFKPTNEFGQALLNDGQLVSTSVSVSAVPVNGVVVLTNTDVPEVTKWDVRTAYIILSDGSQFSFTPDVTRANDTLRVIFHSADETIEGMTSVVINLSLIESVGFVETIEQKIAKALASKNVARIQAVGAEAQATGRPEYKFAGCKTYEDMINAGFTQESYNGEILISLEEGVSQDWRSGLFYGYDGLTEFTSPLPCLKNGAMMFAACANLKVFRSELPNLTYGMMMFTGCSLDQESVDIVANSVPSYPAGEEHPINIGIDSSVIFPQQTFIGKGWNAAPY